jgi:murein DD-endopeptidase MepM/ murein hydrolase activator NlpD
MFGIAPAAASYSTVEPTFHLGIARFNQANDLTSSTLLERRAYRRQRRIVSQVLHDLRLRLLDPQSERMAWPVTGGINTYFGEGHDGVDIEGETGDPVVAARSGAVTFAGDEGDGYGLKVVLAHPGGLETVYAHLASTEVSKGGLAQGVLVGSVGCTGSCSGDHLHFEVRKDGAPVDPLDYLP